MENEAQKKYPLIAVQNTIVFPSTSLFLVIGRPLSIKALRVSQESGGWMVVSAQIPSDSDKGTREIDPRNIYRMGTLCEVRNVQGTEKAGFQILVSGQVRFRIHDIVETQNYLEATGEEFPDDNPDDLESQMLAKNIKNLANNLFKLLPGAEQSLGTLLSQSREYDEIVYHCASYLKLGVLQMQELLTEADVKQKMKKLIEWINREREVLLLEKDIKDKVGKRLNSAQREGLLREQLQTIKDELGENKDKKGDAFALRIKHANMPEDVEKVALEELDRFNLTSSSSPDFQVIENYLDWLCSIPWNEAITDIIDLKQSEKILDQQHYGLAKIKKRILEHLAVNKLNQNQKGPILCLVGPPGVGKTSLGKSIADAMGKKFVRVSLGGLKDTSDIRGHRRTYVGAMPGRIIQSLKRVGVKNPVMLFDEIDKLGTSFQGDPASAMLEVLDPEQNNAFVDNFLDVPYDLSQVFFITTANRLDTIPVPLRDRMEIVELSSYTMNEKIHIAEKFIFPTVLTDTGLKENEIIFPLQHFSFLIDSYTREAGVRELKRVISSICRAGVLEIMNGTVKQLTLDREKIESYLGPPKFLEVQKLRRWVPGLATGLAWTPIGGEVLFLESLKMPGKGGLKLTGQLGDVMKESAEIALSYICSHLTLLKSDYDCKKLDIHMHIPAGAIPKDGPSAGVTIAICLASLILNKEVDRELAMTGELTLSGSILPVGGIKEKVIAAHRYKIKKIILPLKNEKDLFEVPDDIKKDIIFYPVESMDQVLQLVFEMELEKSGKGQAETMENDGDGTLFS